MDPKGKYIHLNYYKSDCIWKLDRWYIIFPLKYHVYTKKKKQKVEQTWQKSTVKAFSFADDLLHHVIASDTYTKQDRADFPTQDCASTNFFSLWYLGLI